MIDWEQEKGKLEYLISQGVTYEHLGRMYGCTGANVKKHAKKLGIKLQERRKINETETFNKGSGKKCKYCGNPIGSRNSDFCSKECKAQFKQNELIEKWKNGEENGCDNCGTPREFLKRYLMEKYDCKCQKCGFDKVNEYTGFSILQIHHIDGDCFNNSENNLQLLCPNCHCLTENFGSRNQNSRRRDKRTKYYKELIEKKLI